jgi:plastocyanin
MVYYENSVLPIEWTNQHGCGGAEQGDPQKMNCNFVIQFTCDTSAAVTDETLQVAMRDGGNTNTADEPNTYADVATTQANNAANFRGVVESEAYYFSCKDRTRNKGLFLADQQLQGDSAKYTRQNNDGGRSGLECPEERDYYPYWSPSPWVDIAYLSNEINNANIDPCAMVAKGSQNNNKLYKCGPVSLTHTGRMPINSTLCTAAGGVWEGFTHNFPAPECKQADWSRDNHLGNQRNNAIPMNYTWTIPSFKTFTGTGNFKTYGPQNDMLKCQIRLRYNITTDDYDPWNTDASRNHNKAAGIVSPVTNNPTVDIEADLQGLRLAINTAQYGRTFQDRSHVFYIKKRPAADAAFASANIYNLQVRGKRGNIVQVYPAVEYDFIPNRLHAKVGDFVHIQWTGSNTHNNGGNGGDGQTGDDGQGRTGTDRSNFVLTLDESVNFPLPLDKYSDNFWVKSQCYTATSGALTAIDDTNCAVIMATSGQYRTADDAAADAANFDGKLNNAPASLVGGIFVQLNAKGTWSYMSSRNNNFSNRSQKGVIYVN